MTGNEAFDVIIVGGGHNGLAAAAYLSKAGQRVLVLERLGHAGGAAVSAQAFDGVDARLSRYSYLVSLLPRQIIDDLGLDIRLARRRYSSYTPDPADPGRGLLIDNGDAAALPRPSPPSARRPVRPRPSTRSTRNCRKLTEALWPTMLSPLPTRSEAMRLAEAAGATEAWNAVMERPIGESITASLQHGLVRGVVLTDALIGTFAQAGSEDLQQNICFLYHLIGGGTGDWDVPVGGMGSVSGELERAAREAGATVLTAAEVTGIDPAGSVTYTRRRRGPGRRCQLGSRQRGPRRAGQAAGQAARFPASEDPNPNHSREGAQVKVNLLLKRLPRLLDQTVSPEAAFGGTFHINETWDQLDEAYRTAESGAIPRPLPCEIYCHSLTDPTILSPELQAAGAQTLTVFGLHVPDRLITEANNDARRAELQAAVLSSLNSVLAEPIEELLLTGTGREPLHRNQDHPGHPAGRRHAARQHLPRRPRLAVRGRRYAAGHPGPALGRCHRR